MTTDRRIPALVVGGIVLLAGGFALSTAQLETGATREPNRLDLVVQNAREIRQALANPIPPPPPLRSTETIPTAPPAALVNAANQAMVNAAAIDDPQPRIEVMPSPPPAPRYTRPRYRVVDRHTIY
jgi:hypothetical protein